jgi:hypothetical protein
VIAVAHGARLDTGEVGPRARLGVALAPTDLATDDPRKVLALLRLVADLKEERPDHLEPEAHERRPDAELDPDEL